MDNNSIPNMDSYVAKYMDENGCSFEEACAELGLDKDTVFNQRYNSCLLYTSPSPRDIQRSRMPSSA